MGGLRVPRTELETAGFLTFAGMRNNRSGPLLVPLAGDREGGVEGIVLSLESLAKGLALMAGIQIIVAARHIHDLNQFSRKLTAQLSGRSVHCSTQPGEHQSWPCQCPAAHSPCS